MLLTLYDNYVFLSFVCIFLSLYFPFAYARCLGKRVSEERRYLTRGDPMFLRMSVYLSSFSLDYLFCPHLLGVSIMAGKATGYLIWVGVELHGVGSATFDDYHIPRLEELILT